MKKDWVRAVREVHRKVGMAGEKEELWVVKGCGEDVTIVGFVGGSCVLSVLDGHSTSQTHPPNPLLAKTPKRNPHAHATSATRPPFPSSTPSPVVLALHPLYQQIHLHITPVHPQPSSVSQHGSLRLFPSKGVVMLMR
jgi:hypothetical protein